MRKTLKNKIIYPIIIGSLLLPASCGDYKDSKKVKDSIKKNFDITESIPNQATGEEDAYNKALEIARNPRSFAIGETIKEKKDLEWYFLQGEELKGMNLAPHNIFKGPPNPYANKIKDFNDKKKVLDWGTEITQQRGQWFNLRENYKKQIINDCEEVGMASYEGEINLDLSIINFKSEESANKYLDVCKMNSLPFKIHVFLTDGKVISQLYIPRIKISHQTYQLLATNLLNYWERLQSKLILNKKTEITQKQYFEQLRETRRISWEKEEYLSDNLNKMIKLYSLWEQMR